MDDTVARYDPVEAILEIAQATDVDMKTVAQVLEGEFDYMGCLGLLDEEGMDDASRQEIETLKRENVDILEVSEGEYETDAAVLFIQRNRGIDKETIGRILQANYRFMDERGFLDEEWGESEPEETRDPAKGPSSRSAAKEQNR
ncbi:MAG: hypothetical protein HZB55_09810 [Deltaproteobacteria bacterium]|nr:hypothetical protein [Deltaproteobacteria bacterium]